jgi:hypothetical protein
MIIGLCERFHKLPSEVMAEDAGLLRMLRIVERGGMPDEQRSRDRGDWEG